LEQVNQNTMLEMKTVEGGVQGARLGNWSIIRKQQARGIGQNQSVRKEILNYKNK